MAVSINRSIQNVYQKLYLYFLDYILPMVTDLNLEMQSEKPKIYLLYSKVETLFKTVIEMFITKPDNSNPIDLLKIDL